MPGNNFLSSMVSGFILGSKMSGSGEGLPDKDMNADPNRTFYYNSEGKPSETKQDFLADKQDKQNKAMNIAQNMASMQPTPMPATHVNTFVAPPVAAAPQMNMPAPLPGAAPAMQTPPQVQPAFQAPTVPQLGMQNMAPPPMQLGQVSDYRAKTSIYAGNKQIEAFLQKVYNRISKGNK